MSSNEDGVEIVRTSGKPIRQVANELGIYDSTLGNWEGTDTHTNTTATNKTIDHHPRETTPAATTTNPPTGPTTRPPTPHHRTFHRPLSTLPTLRQVTTARVMLSGKSRYRPDNRPNIPVQAAQTPMPALRLQQRSPHPRLTQMSQRRVTQLMQRPARRFAEQRPRLLIRQASPTGIRTQIRKSWRLVGSAVGDEHRALLPATQIAG